MAEVRSFTFFVPGPAIPKASARTASGHTFIPERSREYMALVASHCARAHEGFVYDDPVCLTVVVFAQRGKSVTRPMPSVRPDYDNILKAVGDGVSKAGSWTDDSRVVEWHGFMTYARVGEPVGVRVTVSEVDNDDRSRQWLAGQAG